MLYRYYSTQRPVMPGSFPKRKNVDALLNYPGKTFVPAIEREAWGWIDYTEPLEAKEADDYELLGPVQWCGGGGELRQ